MKEERFWRPQRFASLLSSIFCNMWRQLVHLYHVLFITTNICGIDGQKNSGFFRMTNCRYWCWDFHAWFFFEMKAKALPHSTN
jgi:hypothetical protein